MRDRRKKRKMHKYSSMKEINLNPYKRDTATNSAHDERDSATSEPPIHPKPLGCAAEIQFVSC